ncbi:MAG: MMPL family transporter [Acidobacteriota bacterium]
MIRRGLLAIATLALVFGVLSVVDLSPEVTEDFFFAAEDPQLASAREVGELFPGEAQVLVLAQGPSGSSVTHDEGYLESLEALTEELLQLPGVSEVSSLTRGPSTPEAALGSPLWRRLLLPSLPQPLVEGGESESARESGPEASTLLLFLAQGEEQRATAELVTDLESVLASYARPGFELLASGVPVVTEQIRRRLVRDLRVMSLAALLVFGFAAGLVFRSLRAVTGMLLACAAAAALTLGALSGLAVSIGPLTANLATLVFVLTLSHTLFLANAYRRLAVNASAGEASPQAWRSEAVRQTLPASLWCALTTALGFCSLLLTSAQPLRELGVAGLVGTAAALVTAYGIAVPFLGGRPRAGGGLASLGDGLASFGNGIGRAKGPTPGIAALLVILLLLPLWGLQRLSTDPGLLDYFAPGDELRESLEVVDAAGGSSPLDFVVRDPGGEDFTAAGPLQQLAAAQAAIEADPEVGSALSAAVLVEEARRSPIARFLTPAQIFDLLSQPAWGSITQSFVTADRSRARLFLRMREAGREESRSEVVDRLGAAVEAEGLEVELVGGLYDLQGRLSALVTSSLVSGLGGLALLFVVIAWWVGRQPRVAGAMVAALVVVPISALGWLGWLGRPLDVIASPAANVALALGVDSMIHLTLMARRLRADGASAGSQMRGLDWGEARRRLAPAILGAAVVVGSGFGLFTLSSFPPTRSFGVAVVIGTVAAALAALVLLPWLAGWRGADPDSGPGSSSAES